MKLNLLVESTAQAANRPIYGVEIAGNEQNLSGRDNVTAYIQTVSAVVTSGITSMVTTVEEKTLTYVAVTVSSNNAMYTNMDKFINNYDQFYLNAGNSIVSSTGYNSNINRHIEALDGRYPYVCNNMQINTGGMASVNGGVLGGLIQGDDI